MRARFALQRSVVGAEPRPRTLRRAGASVVGGVLLGCLSSGPELHEAMLLDGERFNAERDSLAGKVATISGYLISASMVGDALCVKVLVDETLRRAPETLIARNAEGPPSESEVAEAGDETGRTSTGAARQDAAPVRALESPAADTQRAPAAPGLGGFLGRLAPRAWTVGLPVDPWLVAPRDARAQPAPPAGSADGSDPGQGAPDEALSELEADGEAVGAPARAVGSLPEEAFLAYAPHLRAELARAEAHLVMSGELLEPSDVAVVQACRHPPTRTNRRAARHALQWLAPLKKPERVERAPTLDSLRTELQLLYLARSWGYGWTDLAWEEIRVTGAVLGTDDGFENEVIGGVDMIAYIVGIHDPHRRTWLYIDLTFGDSVAKEAVVKLFSEQAPEAIRRAGGAALR